MCDLSLLRVEHVACNCSSRSIPERSGFIEFGTNCRSFWTQIARHVVCRSCFDYCEQLSSSCSRAFIGGCHGEEAAAFQSIAHGKEWLPVFFSSVGFFFSGFPTF